ncbi:MAG: hypothetical protein LBH60_01580 [Prevotellaceae bacterium]|nr:hypothetical protein [Prevotellaceae bacterium]
MQTVTDKKRLNPANPRYQGTGKIWLTVKQTHTPLNRATTRVAPTIDAHDPDLCRGDFILSVIATTPPVIAGLTRNLNPPHIVSRLFRTLIN